MDFIKGLFSDEKKPDVADVADVAEVIEVPEKKVFRFFLFIVIVSTVIHSPPMYTLVGFIISKLLPFAQLTVPALTGRSAILFFIHSVVLALIIYGALVFSDEGSHWTSPCNVGVEEEEGEGGGGN